MIAVTFNAYDENHILVEGDTSDKINAMLTRKELIQLREAINLYFGDGGWPARDQVR